MKAMKTILSTKRQLVILLSALSLLAACKKDSDSPAAPEKGSILYSMKGTEVSPGKYDLELVSIDPATATVSTLITLSDTFRVGHLHYLPVTHEIVGLDYTGTRLMKINLDTKKTSSVNIELGQFQEYDWLEVDKAGNMYTVGMRYTGRGYAWTMIQIDPATGKTTALATFDNSLQGFQYIPATNELVGSSGDRLRKYNITTKDTASVTFTSTEGYYENMGVDDNSNLYAFKVFNSGNKNAQIVKLDAATGAETVLTTLDDVEPIYDLLFLPKSNELISVYEETTLYKYNLGTNKTTMLPLTTATNVIFDDPTSN